MTSHAWYYARDKEQNGPVSFDDLRRLVTSGKLQAADLLWHEEMDQWTPAGQIEGLFHVRRSASVAETRVKAAKALEQYQEASSGKFWDGVLNWLRTMFSVEVIESLSQNLILWGGLALSVAMLVGPAFATTLAVKTDSIRLILLAVGGAAVLLVLQYVARRLNSALEMLVHATPSRMASTAFLDSFALIGFVGGVSFLVGSVVTALQTDMLSFVVLGVAVFLVCEYVACISLHPQLLNISVSTDATAGDEAIGAVSFFLKVLLRFVPVGFGIGAILGAIGLTIATAMLLLGGEYALRGVALAMMSAWTVAVSALLPFVGYIICISLFLIIDLLHSILAIPGKLDMISNRLMK